MSVTSSTQQPSLGLALILLTGLWLTPSQASLLSFSDHAAFSAALSGLSSQVIDFENTPAGEILAHGSTLDGVTFFMHDETDSPVDGIISADFATTSGTRYLGGNFAGSTTLISGSRVDMLFAATIHAIGMYIIASPGDMGFADDVVLSAGNAISSNGLSPALSLTDGSEVFFIGLIDSDGFNSASLSSVCCGFFEFNIDDIELASFNQGPTDVPAPATLTLFTISLLWLFRYCRPRRSLHKPL